MELAHGPFGAAPNWRSSNYDELNRVANDMSACTLGEDQICFEVRHDPGALGAPLEGAKLERISDRTPEGARVVSRRAADACCLSVRSAGSWTAACECTG